MVDIMILNPIGSFKVDGDNTFFVLRPIFYLKNSLMGDEKTRLSFSSCGPTFSKEINKSTNG
jgi:hypothetical protein